MSLLRVSGWLVALGASLLGVGCAHYQLGTEGKLSFATLYVEPVHNTADIPQASALFETQIRQALLRDGRIQLANSAQAADATLSVDLRSYQRQRATARRDDTGLARTFDINVEALCTLRDNRSGKILFDKRPIEATREIFTSDDFNERTTNKQIVFVSQQLQAEYQTLPLLAQTLGDRVAHAVLDVW